MKQLLTFLLTILTLAGAQAQGFVMYGLGTVTGSNNFGGSVGDQGLVLLNASNGSSQTASPVRITGVRRGQRLVAMDYRPADNLLYALGYDDTLRAPGLNAQLYQLSPGTNSVTAVGTGIRLALGGPTERFSFDFNPVTDQVRVLSTNDANYRLDPVTGAIAATDGTLAYAPGTPPNPANPGVNTAAHTNSFAGATSTTIYTIDYLNNGLYSTLNPPNAGTLNPQATVMVTIPSGPSAGTYGIGQPGDLNLDIYYNAATGLNEGFMTEVTSARSNGTRASNLYTVNLTTGAARLLGNTVPASTAINFEVRDIAISPAPAPPLTWNGSVSTDWATAANWTPAAVPTAANDVTIPGGTPNQPLITQPQSVRAVTLSGGATLSIPTGGALLLGGNFTNNGGSLNSTGTGTVVLNVTAPQSVGGTSPTTFQNLIVGGVGTATATLTGPVNVRGLLTLYGNLSVGSQRLTLISDAAGTAQVYNTGGAVQGTAVVQRYIEPSRNAGLGYRHYSTPASGSTVGGTAAPGYTPIVNPLYNTSATPGTIVPFPNFFAYNEARVTLPGNTLAAFDQGWVSPSSNLAAPLTVTEGYTLNLGAAVTLSFTGQLNNGNVAANGLTRGPQPQSGWHLRGNPYPSPLDWQLMLTNGRLTNIEPALYVFKSSGQYTGTYASYINGVGANGGTNLLPMGQGFFVRTVAGTTGSLLFTNAERLTTLANPAFQRGTADNRLRLTLALNTPSASLETVVYFDDHAQAGFDAASDAAYLPASNGLLLSTEADGEALSINGLPTLTGQPVRLPLRVAATDGGPHTLHVAALENLPADYRAYLHDLVTDSLTDLSRTANITLALPPGAPATGRYELVFTVPQITPQPAQPSQPGPQPATAISLYPNPAHGTATLVLPQALRGPEATAVQVIDQLGRVALRHSFAAGPDENLELPLDQLAPGLYAVRVQTTTGPVIRRLVVE